MSELETSTPSTWRGLPIEYRPVFRPDPGGNGVRPLKASEEVARRIVDDLIAQEYGVGDRFPAESEMLVNYGVARETLREGLRLLEVQGLITIRRGPGGGPFVSPVNAAYLARSASLYFHVAGATYGEMFEAWLHLEPTLAARVARLEDREPVERALRRFVDEPAVPVEIGDGKLLFDAATNFHGILSQLCDNRVLTLLGQAVEHIVTERIIEDLEPLMLRSVIDADHSDLAAAILRGHAKKAEALAYEHICHIRDHFREILPEHEDEVVMWR